jgi:hypothetical protein
MHTAVIVFTPRHHDAGYQERMREMRLHPPTEYPDQWMTRDQVASRLMVSVRTVDRHRTSETLGYCRGRIDSFATAIRFWRPDVEWLMHQQDTVWGVRV